MMKKGPKILFLRTDRLGDVLMALPSLLFLRRALPEASIVLGCKKELVEVLQPTLKAEKIEWISDENCSDFISNEKPDAVLFLFSPLELLKKAWWRRVPHRIGLYSKPWSFLLLSGGITQKRSKSEKSEALYNLDLVRYLARKLGVSAEISSSFPIELKGDEASRKSAEVALTRIGVSPEKPFLIVHPGMSGSALNLSGHQYSQILVRLKEMHGVPLVLSIGPSATDQKMKEFLLSSQPDLPVLEGQSLSVLREIFRLACLVVAPSTGPIHLAHLVGTKTLGFYPPVKSQRAERWAPFGGLVKSIVLSPSVSCPGKTGCIGESCPEYFCMEKWDWSAGLPLTQGRG
jgi:ADP-heptose:LPS heptosyltransferase